jgi:protease-4
MVFPPWKTPRIAVLEISGAIGIQVRGPEMVRTIRYLTEDPRIRGVVVDIDSGGGSAPTSDAIASELRRLSARKPTVAFVMNGALSGGYLIASATRKIVALQTALVGSIGVIITRPVVQELMERLGVRMEMTHRGDLKAMFQPWREPSAEERQRITSLVDDYYGWFVESVAKSRGLDVAKVRQYATGEAYLAVNAKDMGLVDELGDFETAVDMVCEMSRTPRRLQYVRPRRPLLERLLARGGASMASAFLAEADRRLQTRVDFR